MANREEQLCPKKAYNVAKQTKCICIKGKMEQQICNHRLSIGTELKCSQHLEKGHSVKNRIIRKPNHQHILVSQISYPSKVTCEEYKHSIRQGS